MASEDVPFDRSLEGSPGPAEPDEFTAGFLDGIRAHRVDLVNHVRPVVAGYGIRVDADLSVRRVGRVRHLFKLEVFQPDNPSDDPRYAAGFDAGYDQGVEANVLVLQRSLLGEKILLTDEGLAATMVAVGEMVKRLHDRRTSDDERTRFGFELPRPFEADADAAGIDDGTDDEVEPQAEDFETGSGDGPRGEGIPGVDAASEDLDRDLQLDSGADPGSGVQDFVTLVPPAASAELSPQQPMTSEVRPPPASLDPSFCTEEGTAPVPAGVTGQSPEETPRGRQGVWSMFTDVLHRRRVLAGFVGGSITTVLALIPVLLSSDARTPEPAKIQESEWRPPTHWDNEPPESKARFVDIDHWVFDQQAAFGLPAPNVAFVVNLVMGLNGANDVKGIVARYLRDTLNPNYLQGMTVGLSTIRTDAMTRSHLLTAIDRIWHRAGRNLPSGQILATLQNYQNSGDEQDSMAKAILDRVITRIQNN